MSSDDRQLRADVRPLSNPRLHQALAPLKGIVSDPSDPDTALAPDLAFVRAGRLPEFGSDAARYFPRLAPELVVEIPSPRQHRPEVAAKARLWLGAGTTTVWVVWPVPREVDVWFPGESEPVTLSRNDILHGGEVLPHFTYPLSRLW